MKLAVLVAVLAACKPPKPPWTDAITLSPPPEVIHIDEAGQHCFDVVIIGTPAEAATLTAALHEVCIALRDARLRAHVTSANALLGDDAARLAELGLSAALEPTTLGNPGSAHGGVNFYVVASSSLVGPGISEICVNRSSAVRAIGISRGERLQPTDPAKLPPIAATAALVNTIAHETMHLHSKSSSDVCLDRFTDHDSRLVQCHDFTYALGNAAACSYLVRADGTGDAGWQACMEAQAARTPGYQNAPHKDALGCDAP